MPELNIPLFKKIHDRISAAPEVHSQDTWECGSTRCIAGWAVHLTTGEPVFSENNGWRGLHPATRELARRYGLAADSVPAIALRLLGITADEAGRLFYADDDKAAEAVDLAAAGRAEEFAEYVQSLESIN